MKVECEACGHLGAPAEILARPEGVVIVCAQCGAESLMAASPEAEPATPAAQTAPVVEPAPPIASPAPSAAPSAAPRADAVEGLVEEGIRIDPGSGPLRCPKCGFRQAVSPSCVRCGLGGSGLGGSPSAWRGDVPEGKGDLAEALDARWTELCAHGLAAPDADGEAFLAFALQSGLVDRAARLVRLYAQDEFGTDEGEAARLLLGSVIEKSHAVFLVSQGGSSRDVVVERTRQTMKVLYIIVAIMCLGAVGLILFWFMKAS